MLTWIHEEQSREDFSGNPNPVRNNSLYMYATLYRRTWEPCTQNWTFLKKRTWILRCILKLRREQELVFLVDFLNKTKSAIDIWMTLNSLILRILWQYGILKYNLVFMMSCSTLKQLSIVYNRKSTWTGTTLPQKKEM